MDHTMGGGMNMSTSSSSSASSMASASHNITTMSMNDMMMHSTFYWGNNADILFSGFSGNLSAGKYAGALILVFLLAFVVEGLSRSRCLKSRKLNDVVKGLLLSLLHAARMALAYLVMLAVMSFNGGVFIAAVSGHAVGFLVFGTRVFKSGRRASDDDPNFRPYEKHEPGLPPLSC